MKITQFVDACIVSHSFVYGPDKFQLHEQFLKMGILQEFFLNLE